MNGQTIRTITIRGTSEGLDKLTADLHKLAAAEQDVAVVSDDLTKRQISLAAQWKRSTLALDETARAHDKMANQTKLANAAVRQGVATQEQADQHLARVAERYGLVGKAAGTTATHVADLTKQSSRNAAEMLNLSRQVADVGVSLQAGQSLLVVGIQQGAQIIDVFASSGRTVGEILSGAISWVGKFVFSIGGIATVVAGAAAAVGYLASSYASAQKEIDKVLAGRGGASGMTRGGINQISEQSAGGLSIADARSAATAFAATGKIYEENIRSATALTHDFATAMGVDAAEATKQLAKALLDPKQGVLDLNRNFVFLNATTLDYIRTLQAHGDLQGAQKAMMDAAAGGIKRVAGEVSVLTRAYNTAKKALDNFDEANAKAIARSLERVTGADLGGFSEKEQLDRARQRQQSAVGTLARETDPGASKVLIQALTEAVRVATAEVERLEKKMADVGAAKALAILVQEADAFTNSVIPAIAEVARLEEGIIALERAKAKGQGGPNVDAALQIGTKTLLLAQEFLK